jgi:hypothetical protein
LEIPQTARDFHFSHSFNNNNLDHRDHFPQNATASVASLRALIGSSLEHRSRSIGMLIGFTGIPNRPQVQLGRSEQGCHHAILDAAEPDGNTLQ